MTATSLPNPVVMVIILAALSLAPFMLIMLTSFVKISVVLSILRNALGTQSVPPTQVITGLAFVLSFFIMTPVAKQMYASAGTVANTRDIFSEASVRSVFDGVSRGGEPLRRFLVKHAHSEDRLLFVDLARRLDNGAKVDQGGMVPSGTSASLPAAPARSPAPSSATTSSAAGGGSPASSSSATTPSGASRGPLKAASSPPASIQAGPAEGSEPLTPPVTTALPSQNDFQVLIPAFVTSQLKEAFEVGFLVFIPFVIIDMVIANILLAMGMSMLSPSVISLPFKLLLFVLVDGWFLIIRGLVLSYV
jgi:flagellar biosynthesis protein FliP